MPLSTRHLSIKAIFRPFPAADGQIGGHMDIILAVLNRIFHGLSFDISHDHQIKWKIFRGDHPHLRPPLGGQSAPTSKNLLAYENISIKNCPCQFSASQLIRCGHAPLTRYSSIKAIFGSFPAADDQIGGHMNIILAFVNRIFHYLSFDISHDHKKNGNEYPPFTPPWGGSECPHLNFFLNPKNIG